MINDTAENLTENINFTGEFESLEARAERFKIKRRKDFRV